MSVLNYVSLVASCLTGLTWLHAFASSFFHMLYVPSFLLRAYRHSFFTCPTYIDFFKCLHFCTCKIFIGRWKNVLIFLSRAPTHHSFTFNLRFLYELKHKVLPSKTMWDFDSVWFLSKFIFFFNKMNALFDFKTL